MRKLRRTNGIWTASNERGQKFESRDFKEALLWAMGCGSDQAACLRYEMRRHRKEARNAV